MPDKKSKNPLDEPNSYLNYLNGDPYSLGSRYLDKRVIADKSTASLILLLGEPSLESKLSGFLAGRFNKNTNVYDIAIDSYYNTTHTGGAALHHNLDGAHTFQGALDALRLHFPDENDFNLIVKSVEHLSKDLTTSSGINPFLSPDDFETAKHFLTDNLDISSSSVNDLLNINAVELGSLIIATLSVIYSLEKKQMDQMGEYFSRLSIVSVISGNPALMLLSFILMGQSFIQLIKGGEMLKFADGIASGTLSTAAFFVATASLSGPLFPVLILGLASGFGANWLYRKGKSLFADDLDDTFEAMFPAYKSYLKMI